MEHPLRTYRVARNLSIDALAAKVGASKSTISRVETGDQRPSFDLLQRLLKETGISADDFLAFDPRPAPASEHAA